MFLVSNVIAGRPASSFFSSKTYYIVTQALLTMASILQFRRPPKPLLEAIARNPWLPLRAPPLQQTRGLATADLSDLDASKCDRERVVILGSGWAGQSAYSLIKTIIN